jgi:CO/xanthine dehydrogenase Mo-binding subunit
MEAETVNSTQETGPFGAKGVGESSTFAVSPAIANAIHDAVGVRLMDLPIRAEDLLRAMRAAEGRPIGDDE